MEIFNINSGVVRIIVLVSLLSLLLLSLFFCAPFHGVTLALVVLKAGQQRDVLAAAAQLDD